jgi:DNA-binding NarL/FixJ family response regulator
MQIEQDQTTQVASSIRVAIVEPHPLVAEGLRHVLANEEEFEVVGHANSGVDALELIDGVRPNVVVMNLRLPDADAFVVAKQVHELSPDAHVVLLADDAQCQDLACAIEARSVGFLSMKRSPSEIVAALRSAARGELLVRLDEFEDLLDRLHRSSLPQAQLLSTRELEVLKQLALTKSTAQIGEELFVSIHTVRNHVRNILYKLNAHTKLEAVALALQLGILNVDDLSPAGAA